MMLPFLATAAIGRGRWPAIPLPIPLFILWPFVGVALVVALLAERVTATHHGGMARNDVTTGPTGHGAAATLGVATTTKPASIPARQWIRVLCGLPGLRIEIDAADGTSLRFAVY